MNRSSHGVWHKRLRSTAAVLLAVAFLGCGSDSGDGGVTTTAPEAGDVPRSGNIGLALVAENLNSPVALVEPPDGSGRLFIVEQGGLIRILASDGTLSAQPFLDLRDRLIQVAAGSLGERGLLGLAFHPNFALNRRFFVYYSAPLRLGGPAGFDNTSHISEFLVNPLNANLADPASELILLQVDQPQANHNAGTVVFGQDGFLYISLGDGGGANDVGPGHVEDWYDVNGGGNGQDVTQNLLGSILRIDVDGGIPGLVAYGIPPSNPFAGRPELGLPEIFAYGFRNPYRISFDMGGTNQLFAGDVGQLLREEVDIVVRGGNYGWNVKEGTICFSTADPRTPLTNCPTVDPEGDPIIDPIIEFVNLNEPGGLGNAVIGGHVYRGSALPELAGLFVFGSLSSTGGPDGQIFLATPATQGLWPFVEPMITTSADGRLGRFILGFGQDLEGEIYVLTSGGATGEVFKIVPPAG
jgi:glucose/arabinose dehydrogenase